MSADMYKQENGEYPGAIEDMEDGYLDLKPSVLEKWDFTISIDPSGESVTITALSTDKMGGGENKRLSYDIETGEFTGYGQENDGDDGGGDED